MSEDSIVLDFTDINATSYERVCRNDRVEKKNKLTKAQCRQWDKMFKLTGTICNEIEEQNMAFFTERPALYLGLHEEIKIISKKKKTSCLKELCEELADEATREVLNS